MREKLVKQNAYSLKISGQQDKIERESVLALSILTKLNKSLSTIADIHNHLHDGFIESIRRQMTFPAAMKAFSTDPEKINFALDELVLVRDLQKQNY